MNWKWQNGRDCPDCETAGNGGYDLVTSIAGSDGGKTVTATFSKPYTDWQGLFASGSPLYPAHIGAQQGDLNTPAGKRPRSLLRLAPRRTGPAARSR